VPTIFATIVTPVGTAIVAAFIATQCKAFESAL